MTDLFEQLLSQLSPTLGLHLHPDELGACSIRVNPHLKIQLELDLTQERLFFFSKIIEIPPGKFRENVLKEALKTNGHPDPIIGILSYLPSTNHLVLYQWYPVDILNGPLLGALVGAFLEMAENYHTAIQSGQTSPQGSKLAPPPFGIRP